MLFVPDLGFLGPQTFKCCTKCGQVKLLTNKFFIRRKKPGWYSECRVCSFARAAAHQKRYPDMQRARAVRSYHKNPEQFRARKNARYAKHRDKILAQARLREEIPAVKESRKQSQNRSLRKRLTADPSFRAVHNLRAEMSKTLSGKKSKRFLELLDCSPGTFKLHIEQQFEPGISWDNYGAAWHIDHILPCAAFNLQHSEEQEICFHWTNLRPLFAIENLKKGDNII